LEAARMTGLPHITLQTDVRALAATRTVDDTIALLNGWTRERRGEALGQFLFADPLMLKRAERAKRRARRPSIRTMISQAEKSGRRVTSITTPDGTTIHFGEPTPTGDANNPWLDDLKVTKQ
jgi:hypothetical protein